MEFVGVLVFVTLVGMLFNAYFLILPSLEMKKHQIWICSAVLAIIICCLFPLSLFLIPSIIYTLNIFALCKIDFSVHVSADSTSLLRILALEFCLIIFFFSSKALVPSSLLCPVIVKFPRV